MAQPIAVEIGAVDDSSVSFTIAGGFAQPTPVRLSVTQPSVKLHVSGAHAELEAVTLPLGDVMVPASAFPPHGLVLRDLLLQAGPAHADIVHAQDDALELRAKLPLSLHWSVQLDDGSLYPLGTVHTDAVDVEVQLVRADGKITATVQAGCVGTCWAVDGVAKLSDGSVYLEADARVTPTP